MSQVLVYLLIQVVLNKKENAQKLGQVNADEVKDIEDLECGKKNCQLCPSQEVVDSWDSR